MDILHSSLVRLAGADSVKNPLRYGKYRPVRQRSHLPVAAESEECAMPPHKPEDWPKEFTRLLDVGDLEAVMELYDADARFVTRSGNVLAGHERIREVIAELVRSNTKLQGQAVRAIVVGDVALLYSDFTVTSVEATTGRTIPAHQRAIEVLRRQDDDTWKLIIGDPNGRGEDFTTGDA